MVNKVYAELVKFDTQHLGLGVHKRLELYVRANGTYNLNYYLAKLSHEIYASHGVRGHNGRQRIRSNLRHYAYSLLKGTVEEGRPGCPKCGGTDYRVRGGFHLFGINKYECNLCGSLFSNPIDIYNKK